MTITNDNKSTTIRMSPKLHSAIKQLAVQDGTTLYDLVNTALKNYLEARGVKIE